MRQSRAVALRFLLLVPVLLAGACNKVSSNSNGIGAKDIGLAGAWRADVSFSDGALASVKDLKFLYVFNAGGTLTESSNYDGSPPVPPAYGVWRADGPRRFSARYEFFISKPPESMNAIAAGGGCNPAGHGVLNEAITLAGDGQTFRSTITYDVFDASGKPAQGGGKGTVTGTRIDF